MPNDSMTLRFFFQQKHIPFLLFLAPRIKRKLTEAGKLKDYYLTFSYKDVLEAGILPINEDFYIIEVCELIEIQLEELMDLKIKSDPDSEDCFCSVPFYSCGVNEIEDVFYIYLDSDIDWKSITDGLLEGRWSPDPFSWQIRLRSEV